MDYNSFGGLKKQASIAGKQYLRLNCSESDGVLCDYYEKAGFRHVLDIVEQRGLASLYEMRL